MKNCSICSVPMKFTNTPTFNNGKLNDGNIICTSCFKKVNKINPQIAFKLNSHSIEEIKDLLQNSNNTSINKPKGLTTQQKIKTVAFILGAIFLIWFYGFRDSGKKIKYTKSIALIDSRQFVEKRLKAPSTAEFSFESENSVKQVNDTTFFVSGYVDSQNAFGAMIRSNYKCIITYKPSIDKVQCDNLILE